MSHGLHRSAARGRLAAIGMGLVLAWVLPSGVSTAQGQAKDEKSGAAFQPSLDAATCKDWLQRWKPNVVSDSNQRFCDKEMGEGIGWRVSPFLNAYYYGYMATGDREWIDRLIDWSDAVIKRGVKEPDGYIGWPWEILGLSNDAEEIYHTDNELGEAMMLAPMVKMAAEILKTPALQEKYGAKAREYLQLSGKLFEKWNKRGAWREVKEGGVWVVPVFGIIRETTQWGYLPKSNDCFTVPNNMQNLIGEWILAMYDATHEPIYRERAEMWWRVMKSRMRLRDDGKYFVWNYWDPAGPWDHKPDGSLKLWQGVHPNGGYYSVDVGGIVDAYEHGLVFTKEEIARLIATNRDFMWNHQVEHAKFQRIDGEPPDPNYPNTPGVLWGALAPYDPTLWKIFVASFDPGGWGGMDAPEWVLRFGPKSKSAQ
ncbi:MAG: hypothetical protein ABSA67_19225 [Candidatus Brocadiia bacterium]|jgi:hypothetical protein